MRGRWVATLLAKDATERPVSSKLAVRRSPRGASEADDEPPERAHAWDGDCLDLDIVAVTPHGLDDDVDRYAEHDQDRQARGEDLGAVKGIAEGLRGRI